MTPKRRTDKAQVLFPAGLPVSEPVHYDAGETIFSQGDECTDVRYIEEGVVKLTLVSKRGRGGILGFLGRGDFFGENCLNGQAFYSTSAVALVPGSVMVINRKKMIRIINEEPAVCSRFINYLLARNHRIEEDLIDHLFNSCERRLARALLLLAQYDKGSTEELILSQITHDTLAEMVGSTRSRVSVFMSKFRRLGFIHYTRTGGLKIYRSLSQVLEE
jgi:CRP/FNR family cyclic AMP-dependent transcriptional regulator